MFEKEDKYLTFPAGLGFSYNYLEFMKDPSKALLSAQEQLNFAADFSRQMNLIPEDKPVFMTDASRFLWDEVRKILNESVFAESTLTPEEERQLAEAIDFLTDEKIDIDGSKVPVNSPQVSKYYEYKTIAEEAERVYLDEKLSVQFAEGPDAQQLKEKWNSYREKQLKEAWDKAEADWINLGFKRQVEEYSALKNSLELRKYVNLYRQACLDELNISEIFDLNGRGIGFYTTFFSPMDAFEKQLPWTSITLTKSEILGLIREAPPELKTIFGADQGEIDIEAISLEYNNIVIIRPWFKPEYFKSRYWRLPDARIISDGQVPRGGMLPAYITSMIVARNIRVTRRKGAAQQPLVLPILSKSPIQEYREIVKQKPIAKPRPIVKPRPGETPPVVDPALVEMKIDNKKVLSRSILAEKSSFTRLNVAPSTLVAGTTLDSVRGPRNFAATAFKPVADDRKTEVKLAADSMVMETAIHKVKPFYKAAKYEGMTIKTPIRYEILAEYLKNDSRVQPQNDQLVTETIDFDGVSVLALVCKRLPKSPDPDASLKW